MYYIGVDLGTSAVKLLLTDNQGNIKNCISKEYPIYFPAPNYSEQNPTDWYNAVIDGLRELLGDDYGSLVNGISFSGQMHGLVILDKDDNVIRPAILWNDGRTTKECDYLNNSVGIDTLAVNTANIALTGFTAPKLLWVKNNEPENFAKIAKIMLPKDYIAYMLSGVFASDVSDASGTLLFDVKNRCWSDTMIDIVGINKDMLPTIHESSDVIGTIKKELADKLKLNPETAIVIGGGDQAVGAVGTGTVGNGRCCVSLGTSGVVFAASDTFGMKPETTLHSFCDANRHYHYMGVMLSAAASNKWWCDEILKTNDYGAEQKNISTLGHNNVFYLPYLMGERTPLNDPYARGTFIGMSMNTTREDMTLAVLEGVAFALRDSFELIKSLGVNIDRVRINGGGAKSPLWKKIIANVFNVHVDTINSEEGPAFGAAILAMTGCGAYPDVVTATDSLIKVVGSVSPDTELVELYNKQYAKFKKIYPALKPIYKELAD